MRRDRKPVLTSPWKIGVLVALLILVTNAAVAYYMVSKYGIEFSWLERGSGLWGIDSYGFFREMYPLAASVLICSLVAYFAIASAVRRYRYYIDSGQDYRKMISLADSIDDLTNPSQIASLSDYPEFQAILRNYGDQIREISDQINENYEMLDNTELEKEMEALLEGKPVLESVTGDRWWKDSIRELSEKLENGSGDSEVARKENEENRRLIGSAILSFGRITEWIEEARRNLSSIREFAGQVGGSESSAAMPGQQAGMGVNQEVRNALDEISSSLSRLGEGGAAMNDFSETTNGLALNIALLAARGDAGEKDLAGFAEKARSTSEKFKKLSSAVQSLVGKLQTDFSTVRAWAENQSRQEAAPHKDIAGLQSRLEESIKALGRNLENLASDTSQIDQLLRKESKEGFGEQREPAADLQSGEIASGSEDVESEELEILRSDQFVGGSDERWEQPDSVEDAGEEQIKAEGAGEMNPAGEEPEPSGEIDFAGASVGFEDAEDNIEVQEPEPAASDEQEKQDQMWASLNISGDTGEETDKETGIEFSDKPEPELEDQTAPEEKAGETEAEDTPVGQDAYQIDPQSVTGVEAAYSEFMDRSVNQQQEAAEAEQEGQKSEEDDPVIDLFDLGAVELSEADITQ
mgnify:CR=1 FL=1